MSAPTDTRGCLCCLNVTGLQARHLVRLLASRPTVVGGMAWRLVRDGHGTAIYQGPRMVDGRWEVIFLLPTKIVHVEAVWTE